MSQYLSAIPDVILWGCGALFGLTCLVAVVLSWQSGAVAGQVGLMVSALEGLRGDARRGVSGAGLEELRGRCGELGGLVVGWWNCVEERAESYGDEGGWFLTERARNVLPYEVVVGRNLHSALFAAFPGLLAGSGLMLTFIAILWALYGVHYNNADAADPITGIDVLINGLSGKFLSSIVALFLSIFFTVFEKRRGRLVRLSYERLVSSISASIPYLSQARILIDMQRISAQQTASLSSISGGVLKSLEGSLDQALSRMGDQFQETLAGATTQEFGNLAATLEGTRQMLAEAGQTSRAQMKYGKDQTDSMVALMDSLTRKLQDSADQNLKHVRSELSSIVGDVTERVGSLSAGMIQRTGDWSGATARQFEVLLDGIGARSVEFQKAGETLLEARGLLASTLSESTVALQQMAEASRNVQIYSTGLVAIGQQNENVATQLRHVSGHMRDSAEQNEKLLAEYKSVIETLDLSLSKIMGSIQKGMQDYNQSIESNFRAVVGISNSVVPDIASLLTTQVEELSGQFEELSGVIARVADRANGRVKQS